MPKVIFTNSFKYNWNIGAGNDYLSYMERPAAFVPKAKEQARSESSDSTSYDYMDYMADEEKSDGLFTSDKDCLSAAEVEQYRQYEIQSRSEGCPKYIQVVSFDNSFLEENHIMINGTVDKAKLRTAFRQAMAALIENEPKLEPGNCYWTASIHTNTDNVHIHSALCEFHRLEDRTKKYKDKDMLSVEAMNKLKSVMLNYLTENNERTKEHTRIERELLLPSLKKAFTNTTTQMIELRRILPAEGGWQYNRPKMKPYRARIDALVDNIISSDSNLKHLFNTYTSSLNSLAEYYKEVYGEGTTDQYVNYTVNTLNDFYARAGNSLLKALSGLEDTAEPDVPDSIDSSMDNDEDITNGDNDIDYADYRITADKVKLVHTQRYRDAVAQLNAHNVKDAHELLLVEADNNNALAFIKLGQIYREHLLGYKKDDDEQADRYDTMAFNSLLYLRDTKNKVNQDYISFMLGKMYLQGRGCNVDNNKAFQCFSAAADDPNGAYMLGNCYRYGIGTSTAPDKAVEAYTIADSKSNPYAAYVLAQCYDHGIGVEADADKADEKYKSALNSFIKMNDTLPSAGIQYKIGMMYLKGKGCDPDQSEAVKWLSKSSDNGDKNAMYQLGKVHLKNNDFEKAEKYLLKAVNKGHSDAEYVLGNYYLKNCSADRKKTEIGISLLERQARNDNVNALCQLGTRYLSEKKYSNDRGVEYLKRAAYVHDNQYAQCRLGAYYCDHHKYKLAEDVLRKAADNNNSYAYYQLGRVYSLRGHSNKAMRYYRRSAELGNDTANKLIQRRTTANNRLRQSVAYSRHIRSINMMRNASSILLSLCAEQERHLKQLQQEFEEENNIVNDYDYGIGY